DPRRHRLLLVQQVRPRRLLRGGGRTRRRDRGAGVGRRLRRQRGRVHGGAGGRGAGGGRQGRRDHAAVAGRPRHRRRAMRRVDRHRDDARAQGPPRAARRRVRGPARRVGHLRGGVRGPRRPDAGLPREAGRAAERRGVLRAAAGHDRARHRAPLHPAGRPRRVRRRRERRGGDRVP
ncbi:MAG: Phosphoribohydrolase involved in Mycobacterial cytokinins production, homolog of plant cytokinin-activating enzyme LOG, partial [uncultured Phycisphaerae bacterium]